VTVLEPGRVFVTELGLPGRYRLVHDVQQLGVRLLPGASVTALGDPGLTWTDDDGEHVEPFDSVVVASGARPDPSLVEALRADGIEARAVGDCRDVRRIEGAFRDAAELAVSLSV
jgi:2,4-dienoyl-CoA reductase (NADPH2)